MSTWLRPLKDIRFAEVLDGRLGRHGVREEVKADSKEGYRYLSGSDGVLVVAQSEDGTCTFYRRSFTPVPWAVLDALTAEFRTELVTDQDHRYWGCETKEEWDAACQKLASKHEDEFYDDIVHYLRSEPHNLSPGTIGMKQAEIAKTLVAQDPSLMMPENRGALLAAVEHIFQQREGTTVTLTQEDMAQAILMATRSGDLPRS